MANKERRSKKRQRLVVLFQPEDKAAKKWPHPVTIARGHFESPDELTAKCQEGMTILPPHHQQTGTVLVGRELDEHIASKQFAKKGHTWRASPGVSFITFLQGLCNQELFCSRTQASV